MTDDVDQIDRNRRHFLTVATLVTGGAGVVAATIPFLASLKPSARAQSTAPLSTAWRARNSAEDPVEQLLFTFTTGIPVMPT